MENNTIHDFSKNNFSINLPDLLAIQVESWKDFLQEDVMDNPKLKDKFIKQMEIQDKIHGTNWRDFVNE